MFHVPLHRKIAAAGAHTLDDVRDNPSAYSWTGPPYSKLVLFSNNGNDFDGVSLNLTLNGCNYKTGTGGGLEQPGGGLPAKSSPAVQFFIASSNCSLIVFYTLNAVWLNSREIIDYLNITTYFRSAGADVIRLLGQGDGFGKIGTELTTCAACRNITGIMHQVGLAFDQSISGRDANRMFTNGTVNGTGVNRTTLPPPWYFQDFGGDTLGNAGPASVINMIIGFESTLSDQNMIDIMNDPASFFS